MSVHVASSGALLFTVSRKPFHTAPSWSQSEQQLFNYVVCRVHRFFEINKSETHFRIALVWLFVDLLESGWTPAHIRQLQHRMHRYPDAPPWSTVRALVSCPPL
eukprot:11197430-Lingulodinium_polyedra.AAC.1